ncbi:hypothetical protein MMC12_002630 [Toensbergia leucococca]|nr:hypothetical protein [Toensbergia leucococca]
MNASKPTLLGLPLELRDKIHVHVLGPFKHYPMDNTRTSSGINEVLRSSFSYVDRSVLLRLPNFCAFWKRENSIYCFSKPENLDRFLQQQENLANQIHSFDLTFSGTGLEFQGMEWGYAILKMPETTSFVRFNVTDETQDLTCLIWYGYFIWVKIGRRAGFLQIEVLGATDEDQAIKLAGWIGHSTVVFNGRRYRKRPDGTISCQ